MKAEPLRELDLSDLLGGPCPDSVSRAVLWATIHRLADERDQARGLVAMVAADAGNPFFQTAGALPAETYEATQKAIAAWEPAADPELGET